MKSLLEKFEDKFILEPNSGCWLWLGATDLRGYGRVSRPTYGESLAHRAAYRLYIGAIPNLVLCHRCDIPSCVNPWHLFPGTQSDNLRDAAAKNRNYWGKRSHCKHGHPYTDENTAMRVRPERGYALSRVCITCRNIWNAGRNPALP